ncbi:hypothetical protein [uncultured Alsobacter sp.]|uniref:hypothetical protein n=1 Tax=uncultured Alsobacter sp. TaxID=1748258 RepID=UPI0025F8FB7F|nr:hypothetical protein [uncultured Alsobacter sp.]
MEYKSVEQLRDLADVRVSEKQPMTRRQRLERWAELLEQDPERRLRSLGEIELKAPSERPLMRAPDSPIAVAFADPMLRAEGLAGDRLGDAMTFFEISEDDAHRLMCSCMNGWSMASGKVGKSVRRIANPMMRYDTALMLAVGTIVAAPALAFVFG